MNLFLSFKFDPVTNIPSFIFETLWTFLILSQNQGALKQSRKYNRKYMSYSMTVPQLLYQEKNLYLSDLQRMSQRKT